MIPHPTDPGAHRRLAARLVGLADGLALESKLDSHVGALCAPPCQLCLSTSVFLGQLSHLIYLWRWAHVESADATPPVGVRP